MATVRKYRERWVADFRDQNGRRRIEAPKGAFETKALEKRAARDLLARRVAEVSAHSFTPARDRLTFAQLAQHWIESKVKIRATTRSDYAIMLDCYLLPYFGARKLETITRMDVEQFSADMNRGVPESVSRARDSRRLELQAQDAHARLKALTPGPRTTNKCLGVLVSVLKYAMEHNYVARNVAANIDKLPTAEGEARVIESNVLAPTELRKVIATAVDPFRIPIMLAVYCGMRQAEALGLQWGDIDWNRGTAEIRRTYRCGAFYQPKTASSRRTVELPAELLSELKRWRLRCVKTDDDLVCPSATGKPMQASALLQQGFLPALRRAGVRRVRYHDLRHSYASNLLADGIDIVTVSKSLGHSNVHITLVTYSHAVPKARHGATDRMARLLAQDGNKMETGAAGAAAGQTVSAA